MLLAVVLTLRTSGDQSQNRYERSNSIIPRGKLRQVFSYSSSSMDFSMWRIMSKHIRRSMVHALGLPFYTWAGLQRSPSHCGEIDVIGNPWMDIYVRK